jgi:AcrR family transcriptional regulator
MKDLKVPKVPASRAPQREPKRLRTQLERRTETRKSLIDAATKLLHERGATHFTLGDVAARAGVTIGAVQHHFSTRQDLLVCVFEDLYPRRSVQVYREDVGALPLEQRADRIVEMYWKRLYGRPDYLAIWQLILGTRGQKKMAKRLRDLQQDIVNAAIKDLRQVFRDFEMSTDTALAIWIFISSQLRGLALLSVFEHSEVIDRQLVLLQSIVRNLLSGSGAVSSSSEALAHTSLEPQSQARGRGRFPRSR